MHAILPIAGKGSSDWSYAWIPVVAPLIGGVLRAGRTALRRAVPEIETGGAATAARRT